MNYVDIIKHITINPVSLMCYIVSILSLYLASVGDFKNSIIIIGLLVLIRLPFPMELKNEEQ